MATDLEFDFVLTTAKATEDLVADELRHLGAKSVKVAVGTVSCKGDLGLAYRACLESRVASRVLLPIATFDAGDPDALYKGVGTVDWAQHLGENDTLAVDFSTSRSNITHTQFGAQRVKDAVVDQFRDRAGQRPNVERDQPHVRINVHLLRNVANVSIDLSGEGLHRRGYRDASVHAPLKETLAAAVLMRARWPEMCARGGAFIDPMCGSGTLVIEAALMALDISPGLLRRYWGFLGWRGHNRELWQEVLTAAENRPRPAEVPPMSGFDFDGRAIRAAEVCARTARVDHVVSFGQGDIEKLTPSAATGMMVANPPYGERIGDAAELAPLYEQLGRILRERFANWTAHVLGGNIELLRRIPMRASRENVLWNGPIECKLLHYTVSPPRDENAPRRPEPKDEDSAFANRLRKNLTTLGRWAERAGVSCYRLYDADMPEFAVAVDLYEGFAHVQEYAPPKTIDPDQARRRFNEVMRHVPHVLGLPPSHVFAKIRQKQKGGRQYEKHGGQGAFHTVHEGGHPFLVNFTDYLDTGLFLDHRMTRALIGDLAKGRRFLNLFAYTGTATVYAAKGGAKATTTVDLSNTYLDWAERNFAANGLAHGAHNLVRADCRELVRQTPERYDLIFLDPPTFSTSKSMVGTLDTQRDHVDLLRDTAKLLTPRGILIFSTNFRRFRLDYEALDGLAVEDITEATMPKDFARNARIHQVFRITLK